MSGTQSGLLGSGGIKSIQRGVISATAAGATATITAVNPGKTELRQLGGGTVDVAGYPGVSARIVLTNATTITATASSNPGGAFPVSWELTEWN